MAKKPFSCGTLGNPKWAGVMGSQPQCGIWVILPSHKASSHVRGGGGGGGGSGGSGGSVLPASCTIHSLFPLFLKCLPPCCAISVTEKL